MNPHLNVACAIIERHGLVLAARRAPGRSMAGKWEFPGGKIKPGEIPAAALARELREELDLAVEIIGPRPPHTHHYPEFTVTLHPFHCRLRLDADPDGPPPAIASSDHDDLAWLAPERLAGLDWAEADVEIVKALGLEGFDISWHNK